ncbi:MAG: energy transducer TonB [Deltaproteobacteria bacterium]|nr:energy transducer TonB [Deltaproteobacteria bacterium]
MEKMSIQKDLLLAAIIAIVIHIGMAFSRVPVEYPSVHVNADDRQHLRISFVSIKPEVKKKIQNKQLIKKKKRVEKIVREDVVTRSRELQPEKNIQPEPLEKQLHPVASISPREMSERPAIVAAIPRYKENVPPAYPRIARRRGYEGIVLLSVKVLDNGNVDEVTIKKSSGRSILDRAALEAVRRWKFDPASRLGTPFTMWVDVPIHFVLQESK